MAQQRVVGLQVTQLSSLKSAPSAALFTELSHIWGWSHICHFSRNLILSRLFPSNCSAPKVFQLETIDNAFLSPLIPQPETTFSSTENKLFQQSLLYFLYKVGCCKIVNFFVAKPALAGKCLRILRILFHLCGHAKPFTYGNRLPGALTVNTLYMQIFTDFLSNHTYILSRPLFYLAGTFKF